MPKTRSRTSVKIPTTRHIVSRHSFYKPVILSGAPLTRYSLTIFLLDLRIPSHKGRLSHREQT
jgi:hypothetical protein